MVKKVQREEVEKTYEIFISGIPYDYTQQQLKQLFDSQSIIKIKMPRYQDSGRCRGYAHIGFNNQQSYQQALEKDRTYIGQRYLEIKPAQGEKHQLPKQIAVPVGCKVLFAKNLPYDATQESIRNFFKGCGIIEDVRMVRNWATKQFKGFAYIDFRDLGSVKKAIKNYNGKSFDGRNVKLDAVVTGMKKGFKKREEIRQEQQ